MLHELRWQPPLDFAQDYAGYDSVMLLHSSLPHEEYGRYSILAVEEKETVTGDWDDLKAALQSDTGDAWNARWFGFLGYEAGQSASTHPSIIPLPSIRFAQYRCVFLFDNIAQTLRWFGEDIPPKPQKDDLNIAEVKSLNSNMTRDEYLKNVEQTLEQIAAGEFYQANITRKFHGEFTQAPDSFALFTRLCDLSPACYSTYLKFDGYAILSSSPECFLTINETGKVESRPIKGTASINTAPEALAISAKDRAENLMIVDLMRNDLSHHCVAGSVETHKLFEVTSYATLHHMASTVTGQRAAEATSLQIIQDCFPPGSMTGAPKKAVIEWCKQSEKIDRGIYSGALGWMAADGQADLSVVIRTLVIHRKKFEFQVGGGIVADSNPQKEWEETLIKAKGISNCLNINDKILEAL